MKRIKKLAYPAWLNILAAALAPVVSYYLLEAITHNPFEIPIQFQILGWLFSYLLSGLLFFLTGRMNLALALPQLFMAVLGTANFFVLSFRQSPILPWDIASMGTALAVADHFSFTFTPRLIIILAGYLILILFSLKVNIRIKKRPLLRTIGTAATIIISAVYVLCLQSDTIMNALDVYEMPFTQDYTYRQNGFFVSFLVNTKYLKVDKPDDYSPDTTAGLLEASVSSGQNTSTDAQDMPNIIVIMNEAFSDLSVLGDFDVSEDYMPYFRSLYGSENTISGNVHVSVLGGNTANTEFEFLTGNTMAFLPTGSIPYQQFISDDLPALPEILKEYGYTTTGLHPYIARGWRRNQIYPMLGFENCLFSADFIYKNRLRGYVTDDAAFKQVIKEYEGKNAESPFFSFLVTMQNHGGYSKEWEDFERTVTVEGMDDLTLPRINAYLTLIKKTDDAFKDLISYFSSVDEKTIVLMFGDHQPNVETSFLEQLYGKSYDSLTEEEMALRYQTPFVLWANYDIEEAQNVEISANYLSALLMDAAGLKKTAYQEFLTSLREKLPVITANFCMDAEGNFYSSNDFDEVKDILNGYEIIQYNYLFDTKNRAEEYYLPGR